MFENILLAKTVEKAGEMSLDMVEQMIQYQHNLLSNTLTVLVVIAGFIAAASVGYNIYISRKKLEDIKHDIISELIGKAEENLKDELKKLDKKINADIKDVRAKAGVGLTALAGKVFHDIKRFDLSSVSWAETVSYNDELHDYESARQGLNLVISDLDKCKSISQQHKDEIRESISSLHKSLNPEKEKIEEILSKLPIKK